MGTSRLPRILVVEDDPTVSVFLKKLLGRCYEVHLAGGTREGMSLFATQKIDVVLLDIMLPDGNGIELLKAYKEKDETVEVIMMSGLEEVETVVEAMKSGAYDYLTKPLSVDKVQATIQRAVSNWRQRYRIAYLEGELGRCRAVVGMVGEDPRMREIYGWIQRVAAADGTVLLQGETGTGKELVAQAIHRHSPRRENPLVVVNCGAIPPTLMESTLFGHDRGAFTGAFNTRIGKFELADSGTVFLDDVDYLEPTLQAKLLRIIQEKEFERVGTNRTIKADIRIIASSNKDLPALIREQRSREDLYFRLNVLPVVVPPLRERRGDIPLLLEHFMRRQAERRKAEPKSLTPEALSDLEAYDWPGNVRELENLVERLCTVVPDRRIRREDLPPPIIGAPKGFPADLKGAVSAFEQRHIDSVLRTTGGNRSRAAEILGIHRNTLLAKINGFKSETCGHAFSSPEVGESSVDRRT
jgi:DNA-binding NtrC family response regulator